MSDITGSIIEEINGQRYTLRLTMRGIAKLQGSYGPTINGLLDGKAGSFPDFNPLLDLVSIALQKGHGLAEADAEQVADDMVTADQEIIGRILKAAFPEAEPGKTQGKKAKAA